MPSMLFRGPRAAETQGVARLQGCGKALEAHLSRGMGRRRVGVSGDTSGRSDSGANARPVQSARELLLITGLQTYGLGNWADVAEQVGTRTKEDCERHYIETYLRERPQGRKEFMPVRLLGHCGRASGRLTLYRP